VTSDERVTPQYLFEALDAEFHFQLDAAATAENAKTPRYCSLSLTDGLGDGLVAWWQQLGGPVWCNPPYSRGSILQWCRKAEQEASDGVTTAMLLPADTSTEYFHTYALQHECRFINRRLSFAGAPTDKGGRLAPAKFGSVIVVFRPSHGLWTWR